MTYVFNGTLNPTQSISLLVHGQVTIIFVVSVCLFVQSFLSRL